MSGHTLIVILVSRTRGEVAAVQIRLRNCGKVTYG